MVLAWAIGARRALGYCARLAGVWRSDLKWLPGSFGVVPLPTYVASWSGWFATSGGYNRNWAATVGNHTPIWSTLDSWYQYQKSMLGFGLGLHDHGSYTAYPWTWLILGRPVSMFSNCLPPGPHMCGTAGATEQKGLAIGTPAVSWAPIPALGFFVAWWARRPECPGSAVPLLERG